MNIIISNATDRPIYEQLYTQFKNAIIVGTLNEGEQLPSIRGLAKDLKISVMTTKRAYDDLERDGFIHSMAGKGSFVAKQNKELLREIYLGQMEDFMQRAWALAPVCGLNKKEVMDLFAMMEEEV